MVFCEPDEGLRYGYVASFGIDLIEFEARNGRTYTIEREGLLPLYNLYVNDMVVDSIWVD